MLVDIGLSPMEALLAATRNPAEMIGKQNELGVIKPGSFADIVVVDGNPLKTLPRPAASRWFSRKGNPSSSAIARNLEIRFPDLFRPS